MSRLFARARRVQPLSWLVLAVLLLSLLTFIQNRQSQQRFEQAQQSRDDTITEIQSLVRRLDCRNPSEIRFYISVADILVEALANPDVSPEVRAELEDASTELRELARTCPGAA